MPPEKPSPKKLEDMSNEELLTLQSGIIDVRCYLDQRLSNLHAIMHDRLEKNLVK